MTTASTANYIRRLAKAIPEFYETRANRKHRLLGKRGLRVSDPSLGTMTFGDKWAWGSSKAEAQKIYETPASSP
jgi:hypothetical protein